MVDRIRPISHNLALVVYAERKGVTGILYVEGCDRAIHGADKAELMFGLIGVTPGNNALRIDADGSRPLTRFLACARCIEGGDSAIGSAHKAVC